MLLVSISLLLLSGACANAVDSFALMAGYRKSAEKPLWPGFNPAGIPVAIYDGTRTLLFGHPKPPAEFVELKDHKGVWSTQGLYPDVRSNTSADIGGVSTATVILSESSRSSLIIHEAFHVFERAHHPSWSGNEVELFVYPREDPTLLRLQRQETEALRKALSAKDPACWTREAIRLRRERFRILPPGSSAYERGNELNEGLAQYVEYLSADQAMELPEKEFAADDVRIRLYATGQAIAVLLDRLDPDWKAKMDKEQVASLDELLEAALPKDSTGHCGFSDRETSLALEKATKDISDLESKLASARNEFLQQPGWKIEILAGDEPLWPNGFDPWNVEPLKGMEVLHSRWVKLGNAAGAIEVLNLASLTEGAGPHPLFSGVRKITIAGLKTEPKIQENENKITIDFEGIHAELRHAHIQRAQLLITVRLE